MKNPLSIKISSLMKILLVIMVVILILIAVGIIYIQQSDKRVIITIDTEKVQKKTEQAIETGKEVGSEALKQTGKTLEKVGETLKGDETELTKSPDEENQKQK